jgi:hypothetical protein
VQGVFRVNCQVNHQFVLELGIAVEFVGIVLSA